MEIKDGLTISADKNITTVSDCNKGENITHTVHIMFACSFECEENCDTDIFLRDSTFVSSEQSSEQAI